MLYILHILRFSELVIEMNKLPIAVGEGRVYGFNDAAQPHTIFNQEAKVRLSIDPRIKECIMVYIRPGGGVCTLKFWDLPYRG